MERNHESTGDGSAEQILDEDEARFYSELGYELQVERELENLNRLISSPQQVQGAAENEEEKQNKAAPAELGTSSSKSPSKSRDYLESGKPPPSSACHLCGRLSIRVELFPCKNHESATCRKSVCIKCFENPDFKSVLEKSSVDFQCPHCTQTCPESARCYSYKKSNRKRAKVQSPTNKNQQ
mmetsp:Transcript_4469/g.7836  ORF Transcript_4469/g.7836 Transcript_4469/m.7836 type:complete len:182 (-) Transcript_4469:349-894(-)